MSVIGEPPPPVKRPAAFMSSDKPKSACCTPENLKPTRWFENRTRYLVLFLGSACISSICSNMTAINFTMICMGNRTENEDGVKAAFTNKEKSYINWAMAVGTLLAAWPYHWLYQKFGARRIFFSAGVISTVSTLLFPLAANTSFYFLLLCRFFQVHFAAIGLITVHWASLKQHGFFIALLSSFSQISVIFTMPVSGLLCESAWGWTSVYYVHGTLSAVLFCLWAFYYRNDPKKHPSMSHIELEKIQRGKGDHDIHEPAPVKSILKNKVVWAVWGAAFGELLMSQFIVMYSSTFLKEVLGFSVEHTGFMVAGPRLAHLAFKIISGLLSDHLKCCSERVKMIIFNSIALMVSGTFFCLLGFVPSNLEGLSIAVLFIIEISTGFICGGFYKCATLVARQHAHFVLSAIQFIKCLSMFIEPLLVLVICQHNTLAEWRIVFIFHGALLILGNIFFSMYATDKPADFTFSPIDYENKAYKGTTNDLPLESKEA